MVRTLCFELPVIRPGPVQVRQGLFIEVIVLVIFNVDQLVHVSILYIGNSVIIITNLDKSEELYPRQVFELIKKNSLGLNEPNNGIFEGYYITIYWQNKCMLTILLAGNI
jgi:hypothetical protein